ncbi:hypothetical protein FSARC_5924 [Fusarium sarcochroum]|uniref:Uncharacterized protein n=1 Tax=Fusarium sarcochroum TaxID=1208366 RepID=A0A8H4TYN9_9HYPO|nr:hypothetical protein FSARC_5924 [Fusarium sarcochroum]
MSDNDDDHQPSTEYADHSNLFIPLPPLPCHTFPQCALEVGRLIRDTPLIINNRSIITSNRTKNCKAYIMVKREGDRTGFLWCDADGNPAERSCIKKTQGLAISRVKADLVELYNKHEKELVREYTGALCIALGRRRIVKFAQRGTALPPVIDDEDRLDPYLREEVLCSVLDPVLN